MPNYQYVATANYHPYTLQEMLMAPMMYKEVAEQREQDFLDYGAKMDAFKRMAMENPDSEAAQIFNAYDDEYRKHYTDFLSNGANTSNRMGMLQLKRRYPSEIGELEKANQRLQEVINERLKEKDSSMMYGKNKLTIDDFLYDRTPNLYQISGNTLMALGEAVGKNISERMYNQGTAGSIVGGQYQLFRETQGMSPQEIAVFMKTQAQDLADSILAERGATENLSSEDYARAKRSVLMGIYNGITYKVTTKPMEDKAVTSAIQLQKEKAMYDYKAKAEAKAAGTESANALSINPRYIYSPKGKIEFKDGRPTDATARTHYDFKLKDSAMQNMAKQNVLGALRGTPLMEVTLDDATNKFKETGKKLDVSELAKNDYTIISDGFSIHGNTILVQDKEGNVKEYRMPENINPTAEANRATALNSAEECRKKIESIEKQVKERYPGVDNPPLTEQEFKDLQKLQIEFKGFLQAAYRYHSQLYVTNETKNQEFKPYGE